MIFPFLLPSIFLLRHVIYLKFPGLPVALVAAVNAKERSTLASPYLASDFVK